VIRSSILFLIALKSGCNITKISQNAALHYALSK
jgi:hypothetical protein